MAFGGGDSMKWVLAFLSFAVAILHRVSLNSVSATCEFSVVNRNMLYNYSLALPIPKFPHGVLSEDGLALSALRCNDFQPLSTYMR